MIENYTKYIKSDNDYNKIQADIKQLSKKKNYNLIQKNLQHIFYGKKY